MYERLITALDSFLTGKDACTCAQTFRNSNAKTIEDLICGEIYYLSDGGYSQIRVTDERLLVLYSISRDGVKEAWDYAIGFRQFLQELINQFVTTIKIKDKNSLDVVINACGGRSEIKTSQVVGRGLRVTNEKKEVVV